MITVTTIEFLCILQLRLNGSLYRDIERESERVSLIVCLKVLVVYSSLATRDSFHFPSFPVLHFPPHNYALLFPALLLCLRLLCPSWFTSPSSPPPPPPSPLLFPSLILPLSITPVGSCPDLGSDVENGNVTYSQPLLEQGRYLQNTTATVSCSEGYTGRGVITCQTNGNWSSPTLPSCESETDNYTLTT